MIQKYTGYKRCIDSCVHLDITDDLIEQALDDERKLHQQKGENNPSTLPLNARMDFLGSIAQNGVKEKVDEWGIALEYFSPFYNSAVHADTCDFVHKGVTVDIQGSPLGQFSDGDPVTRVFRSARFLTKDEKQQKPVDNYLFCKIDLPSRVLHIVGLIGFFTLWEKGLTMEKTGNFKHACHYVFANQLEDFRAFIFGV